MGDFVELLNDPVLLESCIIHRNLEQKIKPHGLNELHDINIQQSLIIKDLMFVLLGDEGCYIRFSEKYNPKDMTSCIKGSDYKIAKYLDVSIKTLTKKIIKFGKFYNAIIKFIELYNKDTFGKIIQKLCSNLIAFKNEYEVLIMEIENQFKFNSRFNLLNLENYLNDKVANPMSHYYEIINSVHQETLKRQEHRGDEFHTFINHLQKDLKNPESVNTGMELSTDLMGFKVCKGGVLLKIIQDRLDSFKGDFHSTTFLNNIFNDIGSSYLAFLNQWLIHGIIDDPFEEFLIKENKFPDKILTYDMEKYWDEKFLIRSDGLINQFKDKQIQSKILLTGKYLNIFKVCNDIENFEVLDEHVIPLTSYDNFEYNVSLFYRRANKLLMKLLFQGYNFKALLNFYLKSFLINNSYADKFIESNFQDLSKNKYKVSLTKLSRSFDSLELSLDTSNFFDLSKEILSIKSIDAESVDSNVLKELLNKSITSSSVTSGNEIDNLTILGLNLNYELQFPLNLIINQSYNFEYQLIFKNQILLKFLDHFMNNSWKEINLASVWRFKNFNNKTKKWILRCHILHNRLRDFLNEIHYYISFEVVDKNVNDLNDYIDNVKTKVENEPLETRFELESSTLGSIYQFNKLPSDNLHISELLNKIGGFLNNILRDSFITDSKSIDTIKQLYYLVIEYNHFLLRLKKSIIMMNRELFENYSELYPDKFNDKEIAGSHMDNRYDQLNILLNHYYENFNHYLTEFMTLIKNLGDLENQQFLTLISKLENCFPDR